MAKKNDCSSINVNQTKPERMPIKFIEDLTEALNERIKNELMTWREANLVKALELFMRTEGYKIGLEELKTKPERRKQNG